MTRWTFIGNSRGALDKCAALRFNKEYEANAERNCENFPRAVQTSVCEAGASVVRHA